jgi:hypothetical protein
MLTILWKKELKNSVQFEVLLNENTIGSIKRGGSLQCELGAQPFQLKFIPKAPKWYGWETLVIDAVPTGSDATLVLSVILPTAVGIFAIANPFNQLHICSCEGLNVVKQEQIK